MSPSCKTLRLLFFAAALFALAGAGCDELSARRNVQKANKLYYEGRYRQAAELYGEALELAPTLTTAHHNAAINYHKLFVPGDESETNMSVAEKAAGHFQSYLEGEPGDPKIIGLLTNIWIDSGQYEKALAYWKEELERDPENRTVLLRLADISRQAGEHDEALEWLHRRVDLEGDADAKVQAYLDIAKLQWSRLNKPDVVDLERIEIADTGIAALRKAAELDPDHADVQSYLGSLYQLRSLAHGAAWARFLDAASQRHHQLRRNEIAEAAKEEAAEAEADAEPGAGAPEEE